MAGPGVPDGNEIVIVQLTQMKRGLPYGRPLLFFFKFFKEKPADRVPPDALLIVQAATKSKQKKPFSLRRASPLPDV
jgi:hypothetical protein